ncbi:sensor histidine kinase [Rugamonas sp. DEMB1]|uniref:sensor histidine kinase n=1 Tax=Rugamonas sp. DEMB1 TaxID=3039386 RepID=UPI00244CB206|nr:HAMP domain-containing sensor histidine kinase [Rugamonas sp. DEMB1]WGG48132.1 HAMP domain-containing sensor histidine kinase [Rugamonas sp. DEMB1]
MLASNTHPPATGTDSKAHAEAQLQLLREYLTGFELAHFSSSLQLIRQMPLAPGQALELEAFQILAQSLHDDAPPNELLLRAKSVQMQAQSENFPMAQAAAWRALQWVQTRMRLYHAALDSVARAGELYQRCGQDALAVQMRAIRCTVLFSSEMYVELRQNCAELLGHPDGLAAPVRALLLNYSASAAYYLAIEEDDEDSAAPHWDDCLALRQQALALACAEGLHYHEGLALLNLAVVTATLGRAAESREYLRQFHRRVEPEHVQPYWVLGLRLCEVLLGCVELPREQAWRTLLAFDAELALEPPHSIGSREIVSHTIRRYGRQWGYLEQTLQACISQVRVERRHKREIANALGETINAVMERPHLQHENAQLAQHGTALENSLAQRNIELSNALCKVQAEVSVRQAAEAALRRAHDELEEQVRARTGELELAMRSLMQQEKQLGMSRMVVGMAHEMNTPLGNARVAASAIAEQGVELQRNLAGGTLKRSQLQALLSHVADGGALLERAISQISALVERFKGLSSHPEQEACGRFDMAELLRMCQGHWQPLMGPQSVRMRLELPEELWLSGYGNGCRQVFQQLFENSIYHGFKGRTGGEIVVAASRVGEELLIEWADDGNGIAAEHLGKVFEPFFTTQLGQSGAGLGLASVHSLVVDMMKGSVAIASAPGEGARVLLRLPVAGGGVELV